MTNILQGLEVEGVSHKHDTGQRKLKGGCSADPPSNNQKHQQE